MSPDLMVARRLVGHHAGINSYASSCDRHLYPRLDQDSLAAAERLIRRSVVKETQSTGEPHASH